MIVVMTTAATRAEIDGVLARLVEQNCRGELTVGVERTIITVVGPRTRALEEDVRTLPQVEKVLRLSKSYELAQRAPGRERTVVRVGGVEIGGEGLALIAGPGTVESREQMLALAQALKAAGADLLSGGCVRPDPSPYAFRGVGEDRALRYLAEAGEASGLPVVAEVSSAADVDVVARRAEMLDVGPLNMQNFGLLEMVAATGKPVLLRRGPAATVDDWLLAAEHVLHAGDGRVVLCEAGIRTYETAMPATADVSAVAVVKSLSHLPVVVDPSHSSGDARIVPAVARAAVAAGADGLVVTVHATPERALQDGALALTPEQFAGLRRSLQPLAAVLGRRMG